jgi:hypothetical protein
MGERQHTTVCTFDMRSPRITASQIHEWVYNTFPLPEDDISMIQIDGPRRKLYIKFVSADRMYEHLPTLQGAHEYKHDNGELSTVQLCAVVLGIRNIRVTSLPPEFPDTTLSAAMSKYGDVKEITSQQWSTQCRYKVPNGVGIVRLNIKKRINSHTTVAGHRAFISYEGKKPTCYN